MTRENLLAEINRLRPNDYDWTLGDLFGASHTTIRRRRIDWDLPLHVRGANR